MRAACVPCQHPLCTCVVACCMSPMLVRNHSSTNALCGEAPDTARPHRHIVSCWLLMLGSTSQAALQ